MPAILRRFSGDFQEMAEPYVEPRVHMKHRFSAKRFAKVISSLSDTQKSYVVKYGFANLLNIVDFKVPTPFLEWVMNHMVVGVAEFIHKDKSIKFSRNMVTQVLGIPSGQRAINLENDDPMVTAEIVQPYLDGNKSPISKAISLLNGNEDEVSFMRTFMLVAISTVICPSTQNNVNLRYLNILMDVSEIQHYDWASHVLQYIVSEVKKFQGTIDSHDGVAATSLYVGSCLPLLAIVYMDFLDLHHDYVSNYKIQYTVPRMCYVSTGDFKFVMNVDRDRSSRLKCEQYGVLPFRDLSTTPYYELPNEHPVEMNNGDQFSGRHTTDESRPPSSPNISFQVDPTVVPIVDKHYYLLRKEFDDELASFVHPMAAVISQRMCHIPNFNILYMCFHSQNSHQMMH
ncbi:hypothetical protein ACP70R_009837 [Stipagrostis hirtigluma subsp. patula]